MFVRFCTHRKRKITKFPYSITLGFPRLIFSILRIKLEIYMGYVLHFTSNKQRCSQFSFFFSYPLTGSGDFQIFSKFADDVLIFAKGRITTDTT